MPADSLPSFRFEPAVLEQLACPVCLGALRLDEGAVLICADCGRAYPIVDGIPVLIAERAELRKAFSVSPETKTRN